MIRRVALALPTISPLGGGVAEAARLHVKALTAAGFEEISVHTLDDRMEKVDPKQWEATLEKLSKADFELLIPGHGPPLTRRQFAAYRRAFSSLLACKEKCEDEWIANVGALIPGEDLKFTRMLMEYYVKLLAKS